MQGMTVYGDAEAIEQLGMTNIDLTFEAGGKAVMDGEEAAYSVGPDGATFESDYMGETAAFKMGMFGDYLLIDFGDALGMDMAFLFTK